MNKYTEKLVNIFDQICILDNKIADQNIPDLKKVEYKQQKKILHNSVKELIEKEYKSLDKPAQLNARNFVLYKLAKLSLLNKQLINQNNSLKSKIKFYSMQKG